MIYYRNAYGVVFAYTSEDERDAFGAPELVKMTPAQVAAHFGDIERLSIPSRVSMRQARLALLSAGLLDSVDEAVDALEGDAGRAAQIEWEYAQEISRSHPFVQSIAQALELTDSQLDDLFRAASLIE